MPDLSSNIVTFVPNDSRDWAIDANSTFTSGAPAAHAQHSRPDVRARSTDTSSGTPAYISYDCGVAGGITPNNVLIMMMYISHDGGESDTLKYRVRIDDVDTIASPSYDSGSGGVAISSPYGERNYAHAMCTPTSGAAGRYLRVDFWATSATYIDIGAISIGAPYQPQLNVRHGSTMPSPTSKLIRTEGDRGQSFSGEGKIYSQSSGQFRFTTETAANDMNEFVAQVGTSRDFVYIWNPTDTARFQQYCFTARFDRFSPISVPNLNLWATSYQLSEIR
jgi:hypothetical protein